MTKNYKNPLLKTIIRKIRRIKTFGFFEIVREKYSVQTAMRALEIKR